MVFKARKDLNGEKDPNIGPGRPKNSDKKAPVTRRSLRDKELLSLVRKLKPHAAAAIMKAVTMMADDKVSDTNQLKAAAFLFVQHKELLVELYEGETPEDEIPEEVQPQDKPTAAYSLHVVRPPTLLPKEE